MRATILGGLTLLLAATGAAAQSQPELRAAAGPEISARTAAATASRATFSVQPESRLWVEGNSTVRRYKCDATRLDATVEADPARRNLALAELEAAVRGVRLAVPVAELECGDNTMNGHMRKALKADANPLIQFRLSSHSVDVAGASATVRMTGALTIAGKQNPITLAAEAVPAANGMLRVKGSHQLSMSQFDIKPPTLMLGTLRVHDPVVVHFDILLKP